jgi:hypothetical protein
MIEQIVLAVLNPLVSKLTDDFLNKRRNTVAIAELQDQVIRLLAGHRELEIEVAQARMAVLSLSRYLALTQGNIFVLRDDRLEVAISPQSERQIVIGHAIDSFSSSVEAHLQRQLGRSSKASAHSGSAVSPPALRSASGEGSMSSKRDRSSEALSKFFDGFEEEIMRARLGREE